MSPRSADRRGLIAFALAAVAGSVDAVGLGEAGRFDSHMTGTTTHAASHLVDGSMLLVLLGALAILAFLAGAGATGWAITAPSPRFHRLNALAVLVACETAIIAAGGAAMAALIPVSTPPGPLPASSWAAMLAVALFAFAMGLQNAATTYLLKPYERTTHVTSNMTDLGSEIGMRLRRAGGRHLAEPDGDTMASAAVCIAGFALGGVGGAALTLALGRWSGLCVAIPPALVAAMLGLGGATPPEREA